MNEGTRLEILDRLLPRVLKYADGNMLGVSVLGLHQQDALELIINREICVLLACFLRRSVNLLVCAEILLLA